MAGLIDYGQDEEGRHWGHLIGPYKEPTVELEGIAETDSGEPIGIGKDGAVYDVHPKLRDIFYQQDVEKMDLGPEAEMGLGVGTERLGRAIGVGLGAFNVPYAAFWGGLNALAEDEGFLKGAVDSAVRSLWKEGDWGATLGENFEIVTGRTIEEEIDLAADTVKDKGTRHNMYAFKKTVAGMAEPVFELLVGAALDFGTIVGAIHHLKAGIKSGTLAKETAEELATLMKNRQELVNVLDNIRRQKTLVAVRDGMKNRVGQKIAQQQQEKVALAASLKADRMRMRMKPATPITPKEPFHKGFVGGLAELEGQVQKEAAESLTKSADSWLGGRAALENMNAVRMQHGLAPYTQTPDGIVKSAATPAPVKTNTIKEADLQKAQEVYQQALDEAATARAFPAAAQTAEALGKAFPEGSPELLRHLTDKLDTFAGAERGLSTAVEEGTKIVLRKMKGKPGPYTKTVHLDPEDLATVKGTTRKLTIGIVDTRDGVIEGTKTYKQAASYDWHHSHMWPQSKVEKLDSGELTTFWVDANGNLRFWEPDRISSEVRQKIREQIDIQRPESPGFTTDFLGMQQMWEGLNKLFKGAKNQTESVDDVLELVEDIFKTQYGGLYSRKTIQVLKEEARNKGYRLGHYKKDKVWKLTRSDKVTDIDVGRPFVDDPVTGAPVVKFRVNPEGKQTWTDKILVGRKKRREVVETAEGLSKIQEGKYKWAHEDLTNEGYLIEGWDPNAKKWLHVDTASTLPEAKQGVKRWEGYLVEHGKRPSEVKNFKKADEVAEFLGLGDNAAEYTKFYNDFHVGLAAEDGMDSFIKWAFPEGLEGVTSKQILKAADKLETMSKSRSKAFLMGDDWIKTSEGVLGRTPTGKKFFELMLGTRNAAERGFANAFLDFSKVIERYKGIDFEEIRMALDGFGDQVSKNAQNAAAELRPTLDKIYIAAEKAGVKIAKYREGYFPHRIFDVDDLRKGPARKMVLEASVKEGKFKSMQEATSALDGYIARWDGNKSDFRFIDWLAKKQNIPRSKALQLWNDTIAPQHNRVTGHLTKSRTADVPWYDRDLTAGIGHYMLEAHKGIENVRRLGKNKELAYRLIDRIEAEGGNWRMADELLQRYTNPAKYQHPGSIAQKALTWNVITKLNPLTTLVNMSQTLATALRTSPGATMRGILSWDKEFAIRAGAIVNQTMRDVMLAHGAGSKWGSYYMRAIGFKKSEEILRTIAANAGKHHAMDLVEMLSKGKRTSYAKRQLASLGLDPDAVAKAGRLTEDQLQEIGKRVSQQTQFRGDKFDLPMRWLGDYGRVVTQFKTFVYNQARLVNRSVLGEAKKGNLRPLMFLLTAYPAVGTGYDVVVNQMLLGKDPPKDMIDAYFRGLTAVGGLGMFQTSLEAMKYGSKAVLESITGPTITETANLIGGIGQVLLNQKDPVPMTVKAIGTRLPAIGRLVRAGMRQNRSRGGTGKTGRTTKTSR